MKIIDIIANNIEILEEKGIDDAYADLITIGMMIKISDNLTDKTQKKVRKFLNNLRIKIGSEQYVKPN